MEDFLEGGLAISEEEIDAPTLKSRLLNGSSHSPFNLEQKSTCFIVHI
jgi:hypothetical protein